MPDPILIYNMLILKFKRNLKIFFNFNKLFLIFLHQFKFFLNVQLHDIAIIKLAKPVKGIKPVKLPTSGSANYDGKTATIMGWGQMADGEDGI